MSLARFRSSTSGTEEVNTFKSEVSSFSDASFLTENTFKVVVVGDSGVGKTCLFTRVCHGKGLAQPEATVGVDYGNQYYTVNGKTVKLQVWDTAGQERFRCGMVRHFYRNADAVIFVYDVSKITTFENLKTWIAECNAHIEMENVKKIIIGNKCDLESRVPINAAMRFGDANRMPVFQISSTNDKNQEDINAIFQNLATDLLRGDEVGTNNKQPSIVRIGARSVASKCC